MSTGFSGSFSGTPLQDAYPGHYGVTSALKNGQSTDVQTYLDSTSMSQSVADAVVQTANATGLIHYQNATLGQAVLIASDMMLVPAHCWPDDTAMVSFPGYKPMKGQAVIDGTTDHPWLKLDYKIVQIPKLDIPPAQLSVSLNSGTGIQFFYKNDTVHVSQYTARRNRYASRSEKALFAGTKGYSGGPRFSPVSESVNAIHQGENEALKLNDIVGSLRAIMSHNQYPHIRAWAEAVLWEMTIVDRYLLNINSSTIVLSPWSVEPDATVKGSTTNLGYAEYKYGNKGGGNRGIEMWVKGLKGKALYKISPNPHGVKKYNKNQVTFYQTIADAFDTKYVASNKNPKQRTLPTSLTVDMWGVEFEAVLE